MAIIRPYTQQTSAPSAELNVRASADDFGGANARGMQQFGETLQNTAIALDHYENQREIADVQVKMETAESQWYERRKELMATATPDKPTAPQLASEMKDYFAQMAGNYKHKGAQQALAKYSSNMTQSMFRQQAAFDLDYQVKHSASQRKSVYEQQDNKVYTDPSQFDSVIARRNEGLASGSGIYSNHGDARVSIALNEANNQANEQTALMARAGSMNNPSIRALLAGKADAVSKPIGEVTAPQLMQSLIQQESGGVHTLPDGTLITSSKGAKGITQIMPATAKDPGFGVKPLQNETKEEYIRFSTDYLGALLKEYKGDHVKALAAYNGGPGTVNDAVKSAGDGWLSKMPEETRNYVAKVGIDVPKEIDPNASVEGKNMPSWFEYLSPNERIRTLSMARERSNQEQRQADQARDRTVKDHIAQLENGIIPKDKLSATAFTDPLQASAYLTTMDMAQRGVEISHKPVGEQTALVNALEPKPENYTLPGAYAVASQAYKVLQKTVSENQKAMGNDSVTYAINEGYGGDTKIEPFKQVDAGTVIPLMAERITKMKAFSSERGVEPKFFSAPEATAIKKRLDNLKPADALAEIEGYRAQLGAEDYRIMMKQVSHGDVSMLGLADIQTSGFGDDSKRQITSENILIGRSIRTAAYKGAENKEEKGIKGVQVPSTNEAYIIASNYFNQSGKLAKLPQSVIQGYVETAIDHYIGKGIKENPAPDLRLSGKEVPTGNEQAFKDSLKAIGATPTNIGGSNVFRPWGMEDTKFRDSADKLVIQASGGKVRRGEYTLVSTYNGLYDVYQAGSPAGLQININEYIPPEKAIPWIGMGGGNGQKAVRMLQAREGRMDGSEPDK